MLFGQNFLQLSPFVSECTMCVGKEQKEVENEIILMRVLISHFPFTAELSHMQLFILYRKGFAVSAAIGFWGMAFHCSSKY